MNRSSWRAGPTGARTGPSAGSAWASASWSPTGASTTFEPRIDAKSLSVTIRIDAKQHHNMLQLTIRGQMWAQPMPLELLLAADLELETGDTQMRDLH